MAPAFVLDSSAAAAPIQRTNPNCPANTAFYNPSHGEDIIVPKGFKVDVFAKDLNQPTGLAFLGSGDSFRVLVIESGKGLPGNCNNNPLTPQEKALEFLLFDLSSCIQNDKQPPPPPVH